MQKSEELGLQQIQIEEEICKFEDLLSSNNMILKMNRDARLYKQINIIVEMINLARKYNSIGFSRNGVRTFLRAVKLYETINSAN